MSTSNAAMPTSASSTRCGVSASSPSRSACMPPLIKDRAVISDRWTLLRDAKTFDDIPAGVAVIVPLALWQTERTAFLARGDVGVWLAPTDDPAAIAGDLAALPVVAVDFPKFTDGRGYSVARLLRDRYGFTGEL